MLVTSFAIFEISRSNSCTYKFVSLLQCLGSKCQILIFDLWSGLTDLFSGLTDIWPFQPLTIITKRSILDVPAALDPPLGILLLIFAYFVVLIFYRGPTIQTRIRCKKILLLKSIDLGMALEQSATHYKQKINVPLARRATYWKFVFGFQKRAKTR